MPVWSRPHHKKIGALKRGHAIGRRLVVLAVAGATILGGGCAGKRARLAGPPMESFAAGEYEIARRQAADVARSTTGLAHDQTALIAGLSAHRLGDTIDAELWLEPLTKSTNDDIAGRAAATLGLIARQKRDDARAATRFAEAASRLEGDDRARADLYAGEALERLGKPHAAQSHYSAATNHATNSALTEALQLRLDEKAYVVQLGAFSERRRAEATARQAVAPARELAIDGPRIVPTRSGSGAILYLVHVGRFVTRTEAESVLARFAQPGIVTVSAVD